MTSNARSDKENYLLKFQGGFEYHKPIRNIEIKIMYKYNPLIQFIAQLIMSYGASVGWALAAPRVSYFKAA